MPLRNFRRSALNSIALALFALSGEVVAQCGIDGPHETASGRVFLDNNGDGQYQRVETGIADVAVSNGCEVVITDDDGYYEIALAATEILFVSKPASYRLPVDTDMLPQFFYRHYPTGTPDVVAGTSVQWLFPVVEPTGLLPETIDFPLLPLDASDEFTAHGFADTQARFELSQDMLREDLINPLIGNPHNVDFGLTVGDVANDNLSIYPRHKAMMGLMGMPQWYVPGNHDVNFASPDARHANETYKRYFGPTYYSFNHGKVHFIVLNNVEYAGANREFADGRYRGFIPPGQLHWLENDLAHVDSEKLLVIATHIPLLAEASDGSSPVANGPNTENFRELLRILEPFDNLYGLAGHDTSNSWKVEINHSHGWNGTPWIAHTLAEVRGNGWTRGPADLRGVRDAMMEDGNPNGYYVLRFNDTNLVPEFIPFPFGPDAGKRLRITLDPLLLAPVDTAINRGYLRPGTQVVVNLFDGGVRDRVWMSIDGQPRQPMRYSVRTDPYVERLHARYENSDDAFGSARRSAHIWEAPLPAGLNPGLHHIVVTTEDEFGQHQRGAFTFELLEDQVPSD